MTPETAAWLVGAAAIAVIGGLVRAAGTLFSRVRELEADNRRQSDQIEAVQGSVKRIEATEREVGQIRVINARILERLEHLPTHADLQLLHDRISRNGDVGQDLAVKFASLETCVSGLRSGVDRLHQLELAREQK